MAKTILVASQKGGTGKTTVCLNLAVALAERRERTLIVDLDPQGAIGLALARGETDWLGLAEYLMQKISRDDAIVQTKLPSLSILPRGRLDPRDAVEFEKAMHAPGVLRNLVHELSKDFDYVLIDTPSGLGMVTRAALTAADYVLVPLQAESLALRSVGQILRVIEHVRNNENGRLLLLGILPTMVELNKTTSVDVMSKVWNGFGGVLETTIPRSDVFAVASQVGLPVNFLAGRRTPEARRFELLASEIESKIQSLLDLGEGDERAQRELL